MFAWRLKKLGAARGSGTTIFFRERARVTQGPQPLACARVSRNPTSFTTSSAAIRPIGPEL